jgi:hypothetical protein
VLKYFLLRKAARSPRALPKADADDATLIEPVDLAVA